MYIKEQTEDFEVSNNVMVNLVPGEKLIYQLKIKFFTRIQILSLLLLLFIPISFIFTIISIITLFFQEYTLLLIIFTFIIFPIASTFLYRMSTALELSIYLTNKKLYLFGETSPLIYNTDIIEMDCFQVVINAKKEKGNKAKIEFISQFFEHEAKLKKIYSRITPYLENASKIIQILESAIWNFGNVKEKLQTIRHMNNSLDFHEFHIPKQNLSLKMYNNKVVFIKENTEQVIEFNTGFYLNYELTTILIKSAFNKSVDKIIKFGPVDNFINIFELIYMNSLSWKKINGFLLNSDELLNLREGISLDSKLDTKSLEFKTINYSEKQLIPFVNNLEKDESIKLAYFPPKYRYLLNYTILYSLFAIPFYVFFFTIFNLTILNFFIYLGLILLLWLFIICPIMHNYMKFVFTSFRMMIKYRNKISSIPYNSILAITCRNEYSRQIIEIHLKNSYEGLNMKINFKIELHPPRKKDLFANILKLIRTERREI